MLIEATILRATLSEDNEFGIDFTLLNVRVALHSHPKHPAAFKLKERLLGQRIWDNEGTRTRFFLLDLIREEQTSREEVDRSRLPGRPPLNVRIHREEPAEIGNADAP